MSEVENKPKPKAGIVIFDLDGCLFDDAWRLGLIDQSLEGEARYQAYHDQLMNDEFLPEGQKYLKNALDFSMFIAFVTARPISVRAATIAKITETFGLAEGFDFQLYMRPEGDHRNSPELKSDVCVALQEWSKSVGTSILGAFDDRADVIEAYQKIGIKGFVLDKNGSDAPMLQHVTDSVAANPLSKFTGGAADQTPAEPTPGVAAEDKADGPVQPQPGQRFDHVADAGDVLFSMGNTFKERNAVYGNNAEVTGRVLAALFPHGVVLKTPGDYEIWHLFELIIVKLTRFTNSGLTHEDSIHDMAAYCAMVELLIGKHNIQIIKG